MKAPNRGKGVRIALTIGLACACTPFLNHTAIAEDSSQTTDPLQQKVEQTAKDYNAAVEESKKLKTRISETEDHLKDIQSEIPKQEQKSVEAMRAHYKFNNESNNLIEMLLGSGTLSEFIATVDYLNLIQNKNYEEMNRLVALKTEYEQSKAGLEADKKKADRQKIQAEKAMEEAKKARQEAQRKAEEKALEQAGEAEAFLKEAREQAQKTAEQHKQEDASSESVDIPKKATPGSIDWETPRSKFIGKWAPRINNYLAGSPLAGTGEIFAEAAWDNGVDPRWSPAISNTESSKGQFCFKPHNAWGWGSNSWGSWEEAIRAHVAGLARGYGHTISVSAAKKYCPPNAANWYANTLAQMERI